jgi:glycosyltransferase involved in cell wall biosynthesis
MMVRRKVFLIYPYYWPHYKAGGPVQSLFNLVQFFHIDVDFFLASNVLDIDGSTSSIPVNIEKWNDGPNGEKVFFSSKLTLQLVYKLVKEVNPDVVFVNGLFNWNTTLGGIFAAKSLKRKLIISPRGMLQAWGLKKSPFVKAVYLKLLKWALTDREHWHATDDLERADILKHFGSHQKVSVALNIPKPVSSPGTSQHPHGKTWSLVFLSLINPNKNLHLVIKAIQQRSRFKLSIYGPVIDQAYWKECERLISSTGDKVHYFGPVPAWDVVTKLKSFHFFILPTQGENFGHAIFDSLSVGTPVIVSKFTPWQGIEDENAGFYIDLTEESVGGLLDRLERLTELEFETLKTGSLRYAEKYWGSRDYKRDYSFLIDI